MEARESEVVVVQRPVGDTRRPYYDGSWNLAFGVNNHLVLLTATALFVIYLVASLLLFVWRWRGCLVRESNNNTTGGAFQRQLSL